MSRLSQKATKTSRRLEAIGAIVADRPGSSTGSRLRGPTKKGTMVFKTFVSHETPIANPCVTSLAAYLRGRVVGRVFVDGTDVIWSFLISLDWTKNSN